MEGDPLYTLGVLRWSYVGLVEDMGRGICSGTSGAGGWKSKAGKRFPVWVMGVGDGGVGIQGSTVVAENCCANSVEVSSSSWKGR